MAGLESPRGEDRSPLQGRGAERAPQAPTPRSPASPPARARSSLKAIAGLPIRRRHTSARLGAAFSGLRAAAVRSYPLGSPIRHCMIGGGPGERRPPTRAAARIGAIVGLIARRRIVACLREDPVGNFSAPFHRNADLRFSRRFQRASMTKPPIRPEPGKTPRT